MPPAIRSAFSIFAATILAGCLALLVAAVPRASQSVPPAKAVAPAEAASPPYLGFDRNEYPGNAALPLLRQTFSFSGYWLNVPPGDTSNTWQGKRAALTASGFGFLVLFNGRLDRALKSESNARTLGASDAAAAVAGATREGFPAGTVIFLDQEEGGQMLPEQQAYVYAWVDGINASGFRAGIYCSGLAAKKSRNATDITANDLQEHAAGRKMIFFIYNDACPPSPGCAFPKQAPSLRPLLPQQSGIPFAEVWQFAQSPRRRNLTATCPSHYDADGNCYAPLFSRADAMDIDVESATSPDPSSGRR
jgi:hypothetical protein